MSTEACVPTPKASAYMKQLCKHFGHRVPAEWTDDAGQVRFDGGRCRLRAEVDALVLSIDADDAESVGRLQEVVGSHLERFGRRDELKVSWSEPLYDATA